jgi:hypothetical protein
MLHLLVAVLFPIALYYKIFNEHKYKSTFIVGGTQWHSWLRHHATSWKVMGSVSSEVNEFFN